MLIDFCQVANKRAQGGTFQIPLNEDGLVLVVWGRIPETKMAIEFKVYKFFGMLKKADLS